MCLHILAKETGRGTKQKLTETKEDVDSNKTMLRYFNTSFSILAKTEGRFSKKTQGLDSTVIKKRSGYP
jgi:hypothetical protein